MTDNEIIIAIAEACGIKVAPYRRFEDVPIGCKINGVLYYNLPDYPNDLNAMQSAVLSQDAEFQSAFDSEMARRSGYRHQHTAREWAHGFITVLRTIGKWKE